LRSCILCFSGSCILRFAGGWVDSPRWHHLPDAGPVWVGYDPACMQMREPMHVHPP